MAVGGSIGLSIALFSMIFALFSKFDWKVFGYTIFIFFIIPVLINQWRSSNQSLKLIRETEKNREETLNKIMGEQ